MASNDGERPRDRQPPETLVVQRRQRGEPVRCLGTPPKKSVIDRDGWPRRRAANSSPAGTGAETPPARVRRFRRGAAPTPRLQCAQDALGGRMERERPEYLQPIPRTRWEFPWLGMWAVLLLGMTGAGIWLHLKTGDAWNARFQSRPDHQASTQRPVTPPPVDAIESKRAASFEEQRLATITEIRLRRAAADEREAAAKRQREELRCISGVAFRRIPGGWENVPGAPCP